MRIFYSLIFFLLQKVYLFGPKLIYTIKNWSLKLSFVKKIGFNFGILNLKKFPN